MKYIPEIAVVLTPNFIRNGLSGERLGPGKILLTKETTSREVNLHQSKNVYDEQCSHHS